MALQKRYILPAISGFVLALGLFDFYAFCKHAALPQTVQPQNADAVIALTGGSGLRIAASIGLIDAGAADHLLISGVHPDVTMTEIEALGGEPSSVYRCCVDLGYQAETTYGNAQEAARWAKTGGHDSLIIVTSNYHMPRSLILLQRAMPELELLPYPVQSLIDPARPFSSFRSAKGLITEWLKWRVTRVIYGNAGKKTETIHP